MTRKVKHFSLHRVVGTELRVVSDVEVGVLPVIQEEEAVIRGYVQHGFWPHQWVTLFVLQDLQPLVRQLQAATGTFPGKADVLDNRPVVNVYDLAEPSGCQIFVNWEAMSREGYWDDPVAVRGLLAHEHAHPLAEGETTRASRGLEMELTVEHLRRGPMGQRWTGVRQSAIRDVLNLLAHKLCLYAPREILANETVIRSGLGDALLHLDRRNVASARSSVAGRGDLQRHFQQEVNQGDLTPAAASLLLLIGDLQGYIDLSLEVAPFYRCGQESEARELETVLQDEVFPHLEPEVEQAYAALVEQYIALRPNLTQDEMQVWCGGVLSSVAEILAAKGLRVGYELRVVS
jgi:hypothetical protein